MDECAKDSDCALTWTDVHGMFLWHEDRAELTVAKACLERGTLGYPVRTCVPAFCRTDADCRAHAGGVCEPIAAHFDIYSWWQRPVQGFACVYPGMGCRTDRDCTSDEKPYCRIDGRTGESLCLKYHLPSLG